MNLSKNILYGSVALSLFFKEAVVFSCSFLISFCATLSAQTVHFIYDNAGNRTARYIDMSYDQDGGVVNEEDESGGEIKDSMINLAALRNKSEVKKEPKVLPLTDGSTKKDGDMDLLIWD